jgi:hypothetical protein
MVPGIVPMRTDTISEKTVPIALHDSRIIDDTFPNGHFFDTSRWSLENSTFVARHVGR